jgi:hypothetical protein
MLIKHTEETAVKRQENSVSRGEYPKVKTIKTRIYANSNAKIVVCRESKTE